MNTIDFLADVKKWFEGKFGTDPVEQSKKIAEAHIERYVASTYTSTSSAVEALFKHHFHLCSAVSGLQSVLADLCKKVDSLMPKPVENPDIGGKDVE